MSASVLEPLRSVLSNVIPGKITDPGLITDIKEQLRLVWDLLPGSEAQKTFASKLYRMEQLTWEPPTLKFMLERHGGTVHGSKRADLHQWTINTVTGEAVCTTGRLRQLRKSAKRLDIRPLVEQTVDAVIAGQPHEWLEWKTTGNTVKVHVGRIIPDSGPQQTVAGRRRRFRDELERRLSELGWNRSSLYVYARSPTSI